MFGYRPRKAAAADIKPPSGGASVRPPSTALEADFVRQVVLADIKSRGPIFRALESEMTARTRA